MKPRDRIITSLNKLVKDAKDAEANFNRILAKNNLAVAIERHGEWVQTSTIAAEHATDMLKQLDGLTGTAFDAKVTELVKWFIGEILRVRPERLDHLIRLTAYKAGYNALTDLLG